MNDLSGGVVGGPPEPVCTLDAGAYVLGALEPEDAAAYEEHLERCAACRRAVADLGPVAGLLGRVPPELLLDAGHEAALPEPPPALLEQLLTAVARERRAGRRRTVVLAALGAAAVLVVGVVLGRAQLAPATTTPDVAAVRLVAPDGRDVPVTADVRLEQVPWGTRVEVTCTYDGARGPYAGSGADYALVVRDADGDEDEVATWTAVPGREVTVPGATTVPWEDIVDVELRTADGTVVLAGEL